MPKLVRLGINGAPEGRGQIMGVIAVAESIVDAPLSVAFARFIDFTDWQHWTPSDFRPVTGPAGALREGDRLTVAFGPNGTMKMRLRVLRLRANKEVCWRGGLPGLIVGEHSYFFADVDGRTRVRSEESFTGLLTLPLIGKSIQRGATQHAARMIESFRQRLAAG